jgi:D-amino-acid dehydrogenase
VALNTRPYLLVFTSRASAEKRLRGLNEQWAAGGHPAARVCDYRELAALEPCLAPAARAGVVVEGQVAVNPSTFVDGLARLAASRGVHICEHTPVTGMDTRNGSVSVRTAAGDVGADTALIAAGVWSHDLLVPLGVRLGIVPGKGYSFSVDVAQPPKHVIMLEDAHIATLPLDGETRMSGAMDLDEDPERFEPQRIATLISAAGTYFNGVDWSSRRNEWVGPRPLTPTGLPFIGAVDAGQRVFVAAGHNMLGVTLAPATAIAVADLICDGQSRVDMQPFAPVASRGRVH